jgi:hypothetical protein
MNRLPRIFILLTVVLGVLAPVTAEPALADPIGGVTIIPGTGSNLDPIRLRTLTGCPVQANAYYATMRGHGFTTDGQIITSNIEAGISHTAGFDVYVALVMRDYADKNHTTLAGRYNLTVYCIGDLTQESFGEFTGSLEFTSPTAYRAIGAAKPVGPPPPPSAVDDFGSAPGLPSTGSAPDPGQLAPSSAAQAPSVNSQDSSPSSQLASQRSDVTNRALLWLILICTVITALVIAAVARQIWKRRAS